MTRRRSSSTVTWSTPPSGRRTTRVAAVADQLVALIEVDAGSWDNQAEGWESYQEAMPDKLARLLDSVFLDSMRIAPRLLELLEERGWRGWTKLERIPAP